MNYLWAGIMLISFVFALINGRLQAFSSAIMDSCEDAIYFMIGIGGIMAVWSGLMHVAKETGLIEKFAKKVMPLMKKVFPYEKDKETLSLMLMSFIANLFGAGNSSTVFSIQAMERLDVENGKSKVASKTMCMFAIASMSMVQLVPITLIKIRNEGGSVTPEDIVLPSFIVGIFTLVVSILVCKFFERKSNERNTK